MTPPTSGAARSVVPTLGSLNWRALLKYGLPLLILAVFPIVSNAYSVGLLAKFLTYAILALSLDLLWGYAGILSFAHGVFFGLGAYSLALSLKYFGDVPGITYIGFLLAIVVPSIVAFLLGSAMFSGGVSGVYFAIVTFALGAIFQSITIVWIDVTGGLNGLYGFGDPKLGIPGLWEFVIQDGSTAAYYLIAISLVLVYLFAHRLVQSPFGQSLRAINSNEQRLLSFGYPVSRVKLAVFVISCAIAGFAGALYVPVGFVSAEIMSILFSTAVIVWVAVGGRGTLYGAVLGALLVNYLQVYMSDLLVYYWYLIVGIFFTIVVLLFPNGLMGVFRQVSDRFARRGE